MVILNIDFTGKNVKKKTIRGTIFETQSSSVLDKLY